VRVIKKRREKLKEFDFLKAAKTEKNPRMKVRYLALGNVSKVKSAREVAKILDIHENSVNEWIKKFYEKGLEGLIEKAGRGAKRKLIIADEKLRREIVNFQDAQSGGSICGRDIKEMIQKKFKVSYGLSTVYSVLSRIGMTWTSVRPQNPKSDVVVQSNFKKTLFRV